MFKPQNFEACFRTLYPKYVNFSRENICLEAFSHGTVISCEKYRVKVSNRRGHHKLAKPRKSSRDLSKFPAVGNHFRRSPNFTQLPLSGCRVRELLTIGRLSLKPPLKLSKRPIPGSIFLSSRDYKKFPKDIFRQV